MELGHKWNYVTRKTTTKFLLIFAQRGMKRMSNFKEIQIMLSFFKFTIIRSSSLWKYIALNGKNHTIIINMPILINPTPQPLTVQPAPLHSSLLLLNPPSPTPSTLLPAMTIYLLQRPPPPLIPHFKPPFLLPSFP